VEVAFHRWLRAEQRFDGVDALKAQIARDCAEAARVLGSGV
jgi:riboflavin kinase/FMN adenylyltransferase